MKAWLLPQIGSLDALTLADLPDPTPGDGEVVLRPTFAALNPADRYLAIGLYPARPPMPHVLGRDAIGVVDSVGPGVTGWQPGDTAMLLRCEVGVTLPGTFAEKVVVPAESLARPPATWTDEQSAGAALVYLTAWMALTQWGDVPPTVVIVNGASGGVGIATIHLARALGHDVAALTRGTAKRDTLLALGADSVFDTNDPAWPAAFKQHYGPRRCGLAVDNISGPGLNDLLKPLGLHGRVSLVGRLGGPVPNFNTAELFFRRLRLGGVAMSTQTATESAVAWAEIVRRLDNAAVRPVVDGVFDFADLPAAFQRLETGPIGKVLLKVR